MQRIGIFGGTFNPIHMGHVRLAQHYIRELQLDKLLIIPTKYPPHKIARDLASSRHRLEMCRLAFADVPEVEVSDIEIQRPGRSYTVDTIRALHQMYPEDRLILLMGTDMLLSMDSLHGVDQIFRLCYPVYMRREGADPVLDGQIVKQIEKLNARYGKVVRRIVGEPLPISSTKIRSLISQGKSIQGLVPAAVEQYIRDHNLYV